ncbi:trigger factor [Clostridium sp. 'White wine YQ']|uniref:trigger factor n=1 Tax=Clostridium sp. 'White wine YQ' TaxID=3027474 RepID=UPI002365D5BF|nr:trigger factor [Clostridium sp. 'White wine YQ']MDD7792979.1 trigger factor [Clostridium sp. 'White wine YQ']
MEVKMEKIETNVVELEIRVEAAKFNEALNKAFKKNQKKFNVPGFRKGKVPMQIVKKYYGVEALLEDAINIAMDESYPEALRNNEISPVDYPEINVVEVGEGKDLVYTAKVTVYPEVELGEYKGVEVEKVSYPVSEEEVDKRLASMQEKNARVETKAEGTVEKGNIAVIDFKGYIDGVAFEGGEGKDYSLEIGSGTFIGDFEDQLVGLAAGESKDVNVSFPENYGKEDLNGKPAKFEVTVKEIKVKELPELDDEFAKEVSEFDTIAEVKEDVRKNITEANAEREKKEFEEAVINKVVDNAKVEIPEVMITKELESMIKDLEQRLQYQGLTLEQYYQFTGNTEESMKDYMKETAAKKVKTDLVLEAVSKKEAIDATEEELKEKAMEVAKMYSAGEAEKMADLILKSQASALKHDAVIEKTVKLLVENVKVK